MGIFSRKKDVKVDKKADEKPAKVKGGQKEATSAKIAENEEKKSSMKELYKSGKTGITEKVRIDEKRKSASTSSDLGIRQVKEDKSKERKYGNAYNVLVKPLVTEKASALGAENKYMFQVANKANKIEISKAIKEVYGIKPLAVNIIKARGKKVRYGGTLGQRKSWKKAVITLPPGKSIKVYEGV